MIPDSPGGSPLKWGTNGAKLALRSVTSQVRTLSDWISGSEAFLQGAENRAWRKKYIDEVLVVRPYEIFLSVLSRLTRPTPTLVTDRDWDYLFVLDGCRYDTFCTVLGREVPYITSPNSGTRGWIKANFVMNPAAGVFQDYTLVTGKREFSPSYFEEKGRHFPFGQSIDVWREHWDDELLTVPPHAMVAYCKEAAQSSRAVFHIQQPHMPFLAFDDPAKPYLHPIVTASRPYGLWWNLAMGKLSLEKAKEAYENTLRLVLVHVAEVLKELEGKVVITGDHGNLFGEYGLWGHPLNVFVPELVQVPWLEVEGGTRLK